ncbi:MAG: cation/H(+) antiporter [Deltaproteobacteria bacterium]|nr:MAG: cation/H(+) antiporter [Deltaproteobacteria bacterium]
MKPLLQTPLALFIVQALLIVSASRLIGLLARRMRQPMVIAEIVAGILLGPSLLGWAAPHTAAAVFPKDSLTLLSMLSQVGLILFMFLVGLEFDGRMLRGRGHTSVVISHTSIIVPFALGAVLAHYLYPRLSAPTVPFASFTLFMGAAMSITAFPVLARILVERRLLHSKLGAVAITCAAVDDVTAWCILAFVVSIARAGSVGDAARTTGLALLYIGVMLTLVRPFLRRLAGRSANKEGLSQNLVAVTLVLLLLSSLATEAIGIHALFGAFLIGCIIPKANGFAQLLADKLEDLVVVFLLPLFFAFSGLRTHVGLLDSASTWGMCGLVIGVACLGKFGGSTVAARLTGLRWQEATALGVLMNTRGLMELIVLNIGLDLGVISPTLFTMMVLMALITTFMTTPVLEWVYPLAELARDQVEEPDFRPRAPSAEAFTVLMCVAYDRSGPGMVTLAGALVGATSETKRLYALRLEPPNDRASFVLGQRAAARETTALEPLLGRAGALGLEVRPLSFVSPQPAFDICNVAAVKGADLVLMGWHKPMLGKAVLGGTVHEVMRRAPASIGVLFDRGLGWVANVMVPYHGSIHDQGALRLAQRLARHSGANVTVLRVTSPGTDAADVIEDGPLSEVLAAEVRPGEGKLTLKIVERADPGHAVLEECARGYDLLLIGVGPEWGLEHRPFGLHPEVIITECPSSLLVVRQYEPALAQQALQAPEHAYLPPPRRARL